MLSSAKRLKESVLDLLTKYHCSSVSAKYNEKHKYKIHKVTSVVFQTLLTLVDQQEIYDTVSDQLESLSTSVIEILTACRLNGQCSGLNG